MRDNYDYIIVGAGAAGCIVASRLSEDGNNTVLLLEAGPQDNALGIKMPAAFGVPKMVLPFKWPAETQAEPGLMGRRLPLRMGRVIGGSSSVNGMSYCRGNPKVYDKWAENGCDGWGYRDVLPFFKKAETNHAKDDEYHGKSGPVQITSGDDRSSGYWNELDQAFIDAGVSAGIRRTFDFDGTEPEGIGYEDRTIYKGQRYSTAKAYLRIAEKRGNLMVQPSATVLRLTGKNDALDAVEFEVDGQTKTVYADKEIILCAGGLMTPHILQHSGVGPAELLGKYEIAVKKDLPGVGQNLQNHPDIVCKYSIDKPVSANKYMYGLGRIKAGLQWLLFKKGPVASNHFVASAFLRTKSDLDLPDIKLSFIPSCLNDSGGILSKDGFQVDVCLTQPRSRGTVEIGSADPRDLPKVTLNYLTDEKDVESMVNSVPIIRELVQQSDLANYNPRELSPGVKMVDANDLEHWIRQTTATTHHGVGTAKMGPENDETSVVDSKGRLKGFPNIRIADASVMPQIVTGGTYGPVIMIAEKMSDLILNDG